MRTIGQTRPGGGPVLNKPNSLTRTKVGEISPQKKEKRSSKGREGVGEEERKGERGKLSFLDARKGKEGFFLSRKRGKRRKRVKGSFPSSLEKEKLPSFSPFPLLHRRSGPPRKVLVFPFLDTLLPIPLSLLYGVGILIQTF